MNLLVEVKCSLVEIVVNEEKQLAIKFLCNFSIVETTLKNLIENNCS